MSEALISAAEQLIAELAPHENRYGSHPTYVDWSDPATGTIARNRSVCSSFASRLFERVYGYTPREIGSWFGKPVPQAEDYYDTIVAERGFERIFHVFDVRPGDVIAVKYPDGSRPTGHVMIAASRARERAPSAPLVADTRQYELGVVDSAHSGHGSHDTRHRPHERSLTGVGRGTLRVYVRPDDLIAGYAWSTRAISKFEAADVRRPAIGRYDARRAPAPAGGPAARTPATEDLSPGDDSAPETLD